VLTTTTSGVGITGPAAICFNSIGRLSANAATTIPGATCTLPTATPPVQTYNIATTGTATANDRPLNVQVALGGQVHMCDPAFTLSSANPEGC
jgi:type IV fimbrial biogenesis protein FimT